MGDFGSARDYKPQLLRTKVSRDFQNRKEIHSIVTTARSCCIYERAKAWEISVFPREGRVVKTVNSAA